MAHKTRRNRTGLDRETVKNISNRPTNGDSPLEAERETTASRTAHACPGSRRSPGELGRLHALYSSTRWFPSRDNVLPSWLRVVIFSNASTHIARRMVGTRARHSRPGTCFLQPLRSPYEPSGKHIAKNNQGASLRGKSRMKQRGGKSGAGTVRSMLPWWGDTRQHGDNRTGESDVCSDARNIPDERGTARAGARSTHNLAEADRVCSGTSTDGGSVPKAQTSALPSMPQKKSCPSDFETSDVPGSRQHERSAELMKSDRADYYGLFERPPPSIPAIDQYVIDENITYQAIRKRGQTEALPLEGAGRVRSLENGVRAPWVALSEGGGEPAMDPSALLYSDEDIDTVLSFFDRMGDSDGRVTLEEMVAGFRTIRREWATLKTEESGRAVLTKLIRLIEVASHSLESWFKATDTARGGRGHGKLTALDLRAGFQKLTTHVAKLQCCCRADNCQRTPKYGFPAVGASPATASISPQKVSSIERKGSTRGDFAKGPRDGKNGCSLSPGATTGTLDPSEEGCDKSGGRGEHNPVDVEVENDTGKEGGRYSEREKAAAGCPPDAKVAVSLNDAGEAAFCREHALEGMVYLGPSKVLSPDEMVITPKEVNDLMRFIDTDVNFELDIAEMRSAIERVTHTAPTRSPTSRAGNLLHVLEKHMHSTGARFTDLFFCIDRDGNGFIELDELRGLFEGLSREPAKRKARAMARAELVRNREILKAERELAARDAFLRLETYKRAGVYAVLKRIEVWQARSGKRLSDAFHGGADAKVGKVGLDVDELGAFMGNLDLDLSPAEAMLVLRHLDTGNNGAVEVHEVVSAVREIKRDESIVRAARYDGKRVTSPGGGGLEGFRSSLGKLLPEGPTVLRPNIETLTHGRASSAPARGRKHDFGGITSGTQRSLLQSSHPGNSETRSPSAALGHWSRSDSCQRGVSAGKREAMGRRSRSAGAAGAGLHSLGRTSSAWHCPPYGGCGNSSFADGGNDAPAAGGSGEPLPPWALGLGLGEGLPGGAAGGAAGWWPAAVNAVEDGAKLNIYTGSVLDGRWLESLDLRLSLTMRATHR